MQRWVVVVLAVVVACKDKPPPAGTETATAVEKPKPEGPSIAPVATNAITFFVPKAASWWVEFSFPCYASAIRLQAGNKPSDAFTKISPLVEPALRAGDIDLDRDVAAIGAWGCAERGACIYIATQLRDPNKLKDLLATAVPGSPPKELGKHHWVVEAPGVQGKRTIHLRAIPVAWPKRLPSDSWSRDAERATHVIFLTGMMGETSAVDPLAAAAEPTASVAKVADVESIVPNAAGRCFLGDVGKQSFQPGYELDRARFVLAAPEGKSDPLTALLNSSRTLDLEVELVLTPPPTEQVVQKWIAQARAWTANVIEPIRAQFAGQGPLVDAFFEIGALLGKSGFRHTLKGKSLMLSFRTDRVTQAQLSSVEKRLEAAVGAQ